MYKFSLVSPSCSRNALQRLIFRRWGVLRSRIQCSSRIGGLLHHPLHHLGAVPTSDGSAEMCFGRLQIMPVGHFGRVAQPIGHDVGGNSSVSSVCRLARRLWNSLSHGCKAGPRMIRSNCVRRLRLAPR